MRQGQNRGGIRCFEILAPVRYRLGHACTAAATEVICLRILANRQNEFDLRHCPKYPFMPGLAAFPPWRQVTTMGIVTRKAETHRHDGEFARVVKSLSINTKPVTQPDARRIVERQARIMDSDTRRLSTNDNVRCRREHANRVGLIWQRCAIARRIAANPACLDFGR